MYSPHEEWGMLAYTGEHPARVTTPANHVEVETSKITSTAKETRGITDRGTAPRFFLTRTRSATQKFTRGIATSESRRPDFTKVETTDFTSQKVVRNSGYGFYLYDSVAEREGHALRVVS